MAENMYQFDLPSHHKSIIKVIGVGGGGGNAVNHMFGQGIKDVDFVVCNTDIQALESSPVPNKIQLGVSLTGGLGAGANPEKGRNAALESKDEIREMLAEDTKMIFITAGMGGGTGTGAAPVIAQIAREMDILTVGIVTAPFAFEGKKKMNQANEGIKALKENCDTVLVILNDKLREIFGNLAIREAFGQADNVLTIAAKGIAEIITVPGYVNVDFEDVKTVMREAGGAVMGSAIASGEGRAKRAAEEALNSPLLNNQNIHGAQKILLSIMSGEEAELQMDELTEVTDYMQEFCGDDAEVIFGHGVDVELGENIKVTVIATGFDNSMIDEPVLKRKLINTQNESKKVEIDERNEPLDNDRRVFDLESNKQITLFNSDEEEFDFKPKGSKKSIDEEEDEFEEKASPSFEFDFLKKEIKDEVEKEDEFDFDNDFEFELDNDFDDPKEEQRQDPIDITRLTTPTIHSRKVELMEQRRKREQLLEGVEREHISTQNFKDKFDVPAYERKKVSLKKVPHSSERNISKFNLTDDNQIVGNNKYLHDNVD
ncbi:MAG: cell division protein FtsZ [Cyclobacteriaceae bacterium]|jgi:cell division protein FtsZ